MEKGFCGHASGQFIESEKYYHTIYKEILPVKYRIQKFEFHLRGYHFLVKMDNASFPRVLELRNNTIHDVQLLKMKVCLQNMILQFIIQKEIITSHGYAILAKSNPSHFSSLNLCTYFHGFYISFDKSKDSIDIGSIISPTSIAKIHPLLVLNFLIRIFLSWYLFKSLSKPLKKMNYGFFDVVVFYSIPAVFSPLEIYQNLYDDTKKESVLWPFLKWFNSLMIWQKDLANIIGKNNLWNMKEEEAKSHDNIHLQSSILLSSFW